MTDCESFEVAIEMQARGALGAEREAELAAHLMGCPSCRRYQALVRQTERTMGAASSTLDFNTLEARINAETNRLRVRSWLPLAVPMAMGLLLSVISGKPEMVFPPLLAVSLLVFAVFRLRVALLSRRAVALSRTREDFLKHYRSLLRRRIRVINVMTVMMPIFLSGTIAQASSGLWPASLRNPAAIAVVVTPLVVGFGFILFLRIRRLPALRRELRDLEAT